MAEIIVENEKRPEIIVSEKGEKSSQSAVIIACMHTYIVYIMFGFHVGTSFSAFISVCHPMVSYQFKLFFWVSIDAVAVLYLCKCWWSDFLLVFVSGIPVAFVAFYVYEKKEEEIDGLVLKVLSKGCKLKSDIARKVLSSKKQN